MTIWNVEAHVGVGPIRFGMMRDAVVRAVGRPPTSLVPEGFALERQFFEHLGAMAHYGEGGECIAVGFARGFEVELEYEGYSLFSHPAGAVREWARGRDPTCDFTDGFTSIALGLSMTADWLDAPDSTEYADEIASAFLVFRPRYWDEEKSRLERAGFPGPSRA